MAYQIPYETETYRVEDALIAGNSRADNPVEFDLAPAGGSDLARLKSVLVASGGLMDEKWSPETQAATIAAMSTGNDVFTRTVLAVRGLTVPAALAVRVGIIPEVPERADAAGVVKPDPKAPVLISDGAQFARVSGFLSGVALGVAFRLIKISSQVDEVDPRFFVRPSGSPSPGTRKRTIGSATPVRKRSGKRGTAESQAPTVDQKPGTSSPSQ
jgi:hypothetical protein